MKEIKISKAMGWRRSRFGDAPDEGDQDFKGQFDEGDQDFN